MSRKGLLAQSKSRFLWMKIIEAVTFPGAPCKYRAYTFNRSLVSQSIMAAKLVAIRIRNWRTRQTMRRDEEKK